MKKSFLFAAAAVAMLTSCSNDEMLQEAQAPQSAIGFNTFVNRPGRAAQNDATVANMTEFRVWGYQSPDGSSGIIQRFDAQKVNNDNGSCSYKPLQYWTPSNEYWFGAIYASGTNSQATYKFTPESTFPADGATLWGGTIQYNNSVNSFSGLNPATGSNDLIYAWWETAAPIESGKEPIVALSFKHLLSKVQFKFTNALPNNSIAITNLKINGVNGYGTLNMNETTPTWVLGTEAQTTCDYPFTMSTSSSAAPIEASKNDVSDFAYMIPCNLGAYNITFDVQQVSKGLVINTYSHTVKVDLNMEMGVYYVLSAEINTSNIDPEGALQPITFSAAVVDWNTAQEVTVYVTSLDNYTLSLAKDATKDIIANLAPQTSTPTTPVWSSDNKDVATVAANTTDNNQATITAVGAGTANITATYTVDGKTFVATCAVTVTEP